MFREEGALHLLVLVAAFGLIGFFVVSSTFNFQDKLFGGLYNKQQGYASVSDPVPTPTPIVTPTPAPINLVKNPGCEVNTLGWSGNNASIARITNLSNVHSGVAACRVNRSTGTSFAIQQNPGVSNPTQGTMYTATAWVKVSSNSGSVGKEVKIRIRQSGGTSATSFTDSVPIKLTTFYQQISITATVDVPGRTDLRVIVRQENAVSGNYFFIDDVSLIVLNPGATLSLQPSSSALGPNCSFGVDINLNTGGFQTDGTDVILKYNPQQVLASSISIGNLYPNYPNVRFDNAVGRVYISGFSSISTPFSGSGKFASVNFLMSGLVSGTVVPIQFDFDPNNKQKTTDSNVVETGTLVDRLNSVTNGSYTIGPSPCPKPT